jgi:hypothetical protein
MALSKQSVKSARRNSAAGRSLAFKHTRATHPSAESDSGTSNRIYRSHVLTADRTPGGMCSHSRGGRSCSDLVGQNMGHLRCGRLARAPHLAFPRPDVRNPYPSSTADGSCAAADDRGGPLVLTRSTDGARWPGPAPVGGRPSGKPSPSRSAPDHNGGR